VQEVLSVWYRTANYADMQVRSPEAANALPLIIIVGGDALALKACYELTSARGQVVTVLWGDGAGGFADKVHALGATFIARKPNDEEALRAAGVLRAASIMTLTDDDHLNLLVALKARDLNSSIRVVMRQFNRTLGRKLEQNLADCSVISLSAHSAATYAGTAVDHQCFYGLQFPNIDGPLVGFASRSTSRSGLAGSTVSDAETDLGERIVAIDGETGYVRDAVLTGNSALTTFGIIRPRPAVLRAPVETREGSAVSLRLSWLAKRWVHLGTLVQRLIVGAVLIYAVATTFFAFKLHLDALKAAYYVLSTMTTVGYGDITPKLDDRTEVVAAMLIMALGVMFTGIFTAIVTARLTQAQWVAVQGLRRIKRRGHIVVCGAGNVGSRVIEYLLMLDQRVVVIEANPKPSIVELSRDRHFDLLTGDATADTTLDLCNFGQAEALVALTNSDAMNLEVALGGRARNPEMTIVIRVGEASFEESVRRHFAITHTYATAALAAPVLAGLARSAGARGRIQIAGRDYAIGEIVQGAGLVGPEVPDSVPLCVWRDEALAYISDFAEVLPHDRVLLLVPVWQLRKDAME